MKFNFIKKMPIEKKKKKDTDGERQRTDDMIHLKCIFSGKKWFLNEMAELTRENAAEEPS